MKQDQDEALLRVDPAVEQRAEQLERALHGDRFDRDGGDVNWTGELELQDFLEDIRDELKATYPAERPSASSVYVEQKSSVAKSRASVGHGAQTAQVRSQQSAPTRNAGYDFEDEALADEAAVASDDEPPVEPTRTPKEGN